MTRNAKQTDGLEGIPLFQETVHQEEGDTDYEGAEALQEEVAELLSEDGEDGEDPVYEGEEPHHSITPEIVSWQSTSDRGGLAGFVLGAFIACAGIALGAGPMVGLESLTQTLGNLGIEPGTLVTVGLVLVFLAGMRGHVTGNASRMADLEQVVAHQTAELQQSVDYLVDQQRIHGDRPPASGEELDRVLVVMQRLDEKINNLTKAFKMYGKPLVEISNQCTDISAEVNEMRTLVEGVQESVAQGFRRGEESLKAMAEGGALQEELRTTVEQVREATRQGFERMQQELTTMADQVAENRGLGSGLERLETRLEEVTGKVLEGLQNAGSGGDGGTDLEGPIREIQREVAALATTMATLQHKIGSGVGGAKAAPQGAPAAPPASAPAKGGGGTAAGGALAHSISGTKKAGGKNVLGAIAKLRQMRN